MTTLQFVIINVVTVITRKQEYCFERCVPCSPFKQFFFKKKKGKFHSSQMRIRTQQADSQDALRTVLLVRSQRHSHKGRKGRRLKVLSFIVTKMNHLHLAGKDKEKG